MNAPIRILLVDDSPYFLDAARDFFEYQDALTVVGAAASEDEAVAQSLALRPDVILLDLNLGQALGLDLIPIFKQQLPETRIIVLTMMEEDSYRAAALQAGADGIVHKSGMAKTMVDAILEIMQHVGVTATTAQSPDPAVHTEQVGDYLQRLGKHLPDLIYRYEFSPQRGFTYVSPSATTMTGYTPEEHYADPDLGFRLIHPDDLHILEQIVQGDLSTQQSFELRWVRKDGTILWVEQRNVNIFNEAGELLAVEGVARDITARKRAEEALRISEHSAQKTLDALTANIAILDETGKIVAVNRSWRAFAQAGEIDPALVSEGVNYLAVCDAANGENAKEAFAIAAGIRAVIRGKKESCQIEYPCHAPGEKRWFVARVTSFSEDGLTRIVVAHENITERKLAEQTVAASEARYRRLFESNPQPMWVYDLETLRFLAVNDTAIFHYGYSREEFLSMTLQDIRPAEDVPALMRNVADVTSVVQNSEGWRHRLRDGRLIDVEITSHVLNFEGRPARLVMVNDVTSRKQAAAKIRQQLERLAALRKIDQAIAANLDLHVSLNVLLAQTVELLTADAAAVLLVNDLTHTLEFAAGTGFWTDAVKSASVALGESHAGKVALERRHVQIPNLADAPDDFLLANALKGERFVSYHGAPLIIKDRVVGVLEVFNRSVVERDEEWFDFLDTLAGQAAIAVENEQLYSTAQHELAERTRAEAELRVLNKELEERVEDRTIELKRLNLELERALRIKDEFFANMSHELRTPLSAIIGLSEILTEQGAGSLNERQQKYVGIINENSNHLLALINDILDIAKSEAGRLTLDPDIVDLRAICESSVRMITQLAQQKQQSVSLEIDAHLEQIWADQRRLKQMLVNLLSNAVKFTPKDGKIGLEARGNQDDNTISFTVWDTGIGIREEDLSRLFRPFVQLGSDMAHKTRGTGLGLALVSQMARLHDGHVSVKSEPGKGSRFTITLPQPPPKT